MPVKPQYAKFLEGHAHTLREKCGLATFARLDPFALAKVMNMEVRYVGDSSGLPGELLTTVLGDAGGSWDAGTLKFPDGRIHVYMNPNKPKDRQHSTLMEEVAHIHLGHQPTEIISCGGIVFRTCSKSHENQAYWVGAAALLPTRIIKGSKTLQRTIKDVAAEHQVSVELVRLRCNIVGVQLAE